MSDDLRPRLLVLGSAHRSGRGLPQNEQPVARSVPVAFASASVIVSVAVATVS